MDLLERRSGAQRHPWETTRARYFLDVITRHGVLRGAPRILDVGAGDTFFARELLRENGSVDVVAWDVNYSDADVAAYTTDHIVATRATPSGPFDAALLLDVIEHVADDAGLVRRVTSLLRPGALVLVSVPAWPRLFTAHDHALRHLRRYTPRALRTVMARAGVDVVEHGSVFTSLLLSRAARALRESITGPVLDGTQNPLAGWTRSARVTSVVTQGLLLEHKLTDALQSRGVSLPGLSTWALCRVRA
jgi:2-polyprenyl-3-methyl-5-hydroxy-6-metoxy-1,4-benzoquinol methylase